MRKESLVLFTLVVGFALIDFIKCQGFIGFDLEKYSFNEKKMQ